MDPPGKADATGPGAELQDILHLAYYLGISR